MALRFDGSQYCVTTTAPITAAPYTMACWYTWWQDANGMLMCLGDKDVTNKQWCMYTNTGGADFLTVYREYLATSDVTLAGTIYKYEWSHAALVVRATNDLSVYNNGSVTTDSADVGIGEWDHLCLGAEGNSGKGNRLNGLISVPTLWDIALTTNDIRRLRHEPPWNVAPAHIVGMWPLRLGRTNYQDVSRNGYHLTPTGAPKFVGDPPMIEKHWLEREMRLFRKVANIPTAMGVTKQMMHYARLRRAA